MTISGKVLKKFDAVQVSEKFQKREFIVETEDGMYPQQILLQFAQDKCKLLDYAKEGDIVNVEFNLKGRLFQDKQGTERCFNTLDAWRINVVTDKPESAIQPNTAFEHTPPSGPVAQPTEDDSSELPF